MSQHCESCNNTSMLTGSYCERCYSHQSRLVDHLRAEIALLKHLNDRAHEKIKIKDKEIFELRQGDMLAKDTPNAPL